MGWYAGVVGQAHSNYIIIMLTIIHMYYLLKVKQLYNNDCIVKPCPPHHSFQHVICPLYVCQVR